MVPARYLPGVSCEQCQAFCEHVRIRDPAFYRHMLLRVIPLVDTGVLEIVDGDGPLRPLVDVVDRGGPWPADVIGHEFRCTRCHQRFFMSVDTYHGSGGAWKPVR